MYKRVTCFASIVIIAGILVACSSSSEIDRDGSNPDSSIRISEYESTKNPNDDVETTTTETVPPIPTETEIDDASVSESGSDDQYILNTELADGYYLATSHYSSESVYEEYSFSEDYTQGVFFISSFLSFAQDEINSIQVGDSIVVLGEDGSDWLNPVEYTVTDVAFPFISTDPTYFGDFMLSQQWHGEYYLVSGIDSLLTIPAGMYRLEFSEDLRIVDDVYVLQGEDPYEENEFSYEISSVEELDRLIEENDCHPSLYIHVENNQIDLICVNPQCHQPWRLDLYGG